jgi:hypothetical protein
VDLICILDSTHRPTSEFPCNEWVELAKKLNVNVAACNKLGLDATGMTGGGSCVIDRDIRIWSQGSSFSNVSIVGGALS